MERQAFRHTQNNYLTPEEIERLGIAFENLKLKLTEIAQEFQISPEELCVEMNNYLGIDSMNKPTTLVDVIDKLIDAKTVIGGRVTISVENIDLIVLDLLAMLSGTLPKNGDSK